MVNSCKYCGAKLGPTHTTCPSCHKSVDSANSTSLNKPLDEIKKNLLDMSSKAISMAKVVGADIANETKKINDARRETVASEELKGAENKKIAFKNGVRIFWQKLTNKQKAIVVGIPLLLFVCLMAVIEDKSTQSTYQSNSGASVAGKPSSGSATCPKITSSMREDAILIAEYECRVWNNKKYGKDKTLDYWNAEGTKIDKKYKDEGMWRACKKEIAGWTYINDRCERGL